MWDRVRKTYEAESKAGNVEYPFEEPILREALAAFRKKTVERYIIEEFEGLGGGHDPEDPQHVAGSPPTNLGLHPNSPGYRLILNNVLFPAAEKKPRRT